jgi:hypothetical protein
MHEESPQTSRDLAASSEQKTIVRGALRSTGERLLDSLNRVRRELQDERASLRSDLESLRNLLSKRPKGAVEGSATSANAFGSGETAEAQAILAAQGRFEAHEARHTKLQIIQRAPSHTGTL